MDEHALIEAIRARLDTSDARVSLGIGDDAAILAPTAGGAVLSVDAAVEGVHFDRRWLTLEEVGHRSVVAALSDLAAMGARPLAALSSLVLPRSMSDAEVLALVDGIAGAARAYDAPVVGGNVASGATLVLSTTVVGEAPPGGALLRGRARAGDAVHVTGTLGTAALGLAALAAGLPESETAAPFMARWRRPRARFDVREALLGVAHAAIDVSDGLLADLGQVCAASGVGAVIECARLPLAPGHDELAAALGQDPDAFALGGGEDYELVFTTAPDVRVPGATPIGHLREGRGVEARERDGRPRATGCHGFQHR